MREVLIFCNTFTIPFDEPSHLTGPSPTLKLKGNFRLKTEGIPYRLKVYRFKLLPVKSFTG